MLQAFGQAFIGQFKQLGSLSNDDGNGNKNVISKQKFPLSLSLRDYCKLFNVTMVWQSLKNETDLSQA